MKLAVTAAAALLATATAANAVDADALAKMFGAREEVDGMRLSPDGGSVLFLSPRPGGHAAVTVVDIATGDGKSIARDAGGSSHLQWCGWKTDKRLICRQGGVVTDGTTLLSYARLGALDRDGSNGKEIGYRPNEHAYGYVQNTGVLMDWLPDDPDNILMAIDVLPTENTGTLSLRDKPGLGAFRVNVNSAKMKNVEQTHPLGYSLISDPKGDVRIMGTQAVGPAGYTKSKIAYSYRASTGGGWQSLLTADLSANATNDIQGFDETGKWIYVLMPTNGRQALYRISTDGANRTELMFAHPSVDVTGITRIGKYSRPVAAEYYTEGRHLMFFDAALAKLDAQLSKALPGHPSVSVLDESWDGNKKLIFAGSDVDPGRYYLYDGTTHKLGELLAVRPQLDGVKLSEVRSVSYPARDGTQIPAYLTLPPGSNGKNLPVVIMPHGGPASRDIWGFDWLAQYFTQLGYAVLQPNFRGSAGYGEAWFKQNGFKSWQIAIGDINDGARWMVSQGIGNRDKLAIVGWSYGGYAALQANVLDPNLYKAAVAIAPVTDLAQLKIKAQDYTSGALVRDYIGNGPHITQGSPAQQAAQFKVPVLMFHADHDVNVDISQSKLMDAALERAGKQHQLVMYKDLDHQLNDADTRADMLSKSAAFLAANVKP